MSDKEQRKAPVLRFKGFTDDWEQRKLKDTANFAKGIGYSKKDLKSSGIPIILYGRLYTKYETVINEIDTFTQPKKDTFLSKGGEIIVPASGETAEDISVASVVKNKGIILGGDLNIVYPNSSLNSVFLALNITYGRAHDEMRRRAQGKTIVHLHNSDLANIKLKIPTISEQKKIVYLLEKINKLIALQQRKLNKLKSLRKGIKESTLPKNLKSPSASFENTGKIFRFSELFKRSSEKNDGSFSKDKVISVANMRWGTAPKNSSDDYMKTYFILRKGDIAFEGNRSKNYSFGRFVANDLEDGIVSHVFIVYRPKKELNLNYLKYYINDEQVMRTPLRMSTSRTTMMTNLVQKDIVKQKLLLPSIQEQNKLGELYKKVDALIQMNQLKLNRLNQLKQFLLQKLFV